MLYHSEQHLQQELLPLSDHLPTGIDGRQLQKKVPNSSTEIKLNSPINQALKDSKTIIRGKPKQKDQVLAFATAIMSCEWYVLEAAAVSAHAIDMVQEQQSSYRHKRYALMDSSTAECAPQLDKPWYITIIKEIPFNLTDIQTSWYARRIEQGHGGRRDFIKLHVYALEEPVAVYMDLHTILLKKIDSLVDAMLEGASAANPPLEHKHGKQWSPKVALDFAFTRDYYAGSTLTNDTR
jgi:hypothetical protein